MFCGIVQQIGTIMALRRNQDIIKLEVKASNIKASVGDSIAVDGVCLTVVDIQENLYVFDITPETAQKTTLKNLKSGMHVNLEMALMLCDRIGGHIVLGHVDCIGVISFQKSQGLSKIIGIKPLDAFKGLIVKKGSVAIDGISLTISDVYDSYFTISLIPHTIENTTLKFKKVGDQVNIEFDYIAKIVRENLR